jgi:hypothetical protein
MSVLSHFNRVEVVIIIIIAIVVMKSRHCRLTFQVIAEIPLVLQQLSIVSRQRLTFGHDVKKEMESVSERLGADAPAVLLPGVKAFAKVRLGECYGNETTAIAQYVAHLLNSKTYQKFKSSLTIYIFSLQMALFIDYYLLE